MRIGVVLPIAQDDVTGLVASYAEIRAVALAAEAAAIDSVWVFDHFLFRADGVTEGIHECWTVLAAIAEATQRVQVGTIVMGTEFRNPALLAKMAATLDHISDGRLILGLGCGWHDPEYEAFGYPTDHKVGRFADALTIISELIRTGRSDHRGRFHAVDDAVLLPPARPDLPILVAAKRPRMLGLTARHADAWNQAWYGRPDDRYARVRAELQRAFEEAGRDPASVEITVGVSVHLPEPGAADPSSDTPALRGTPEDIADGLAAWAGLGVGHLIASLEPATPATVERFADAVRRYRTAPG